MTLAADRLVVLYDRDCGLCSASARALSRWDRDDHLNVVPLQDVASRVPRVASLVAGRRLECAIHVVDPVTARVTTGGAGVLAIARRLPGGAVAGLVAAIPPARWAVELAYGVVAANRHRIGRWMGLDGPVCDVPR